MKMAQTTGTAQFTVQLEFSIALNVHGLKVSRHKVNSGSVWADTERMRPRAASQCCEGLIKPWAKALVWTGHSAATAVSFCLGKTQLSTALAATRTALQEGSTPVCCLRHKVTSDTLTRDSVGSLFPPNRLLSQACWVLLLNSFSKSLLFRVRCDSNQSQHSKIKSAYSHPK